MIGMENLRQAAQGGGASSFKTYVEQKAHETQNAVADVITGLGNEVMGHALLKTLEHIGKAKKALKDAARSKLEGLQDSVSEFADRAEGAINDAQSGVRATVRDGAEQVEDLADRSANPFGGGRVVMGDDGLPRITNVSSLGQTPSLPDGSLDGGIEIGGEEEEERPAPAQPAEVEPEAPEISGSNLSTDLAKGTEDIAEKAGEKVAVKVGEDVGEQSLKGAFLTSLGEDESPIGLAATAALGIATLVAGIVSHHHSKPPPAVEHYVRTQPTNYSYQSGL